VGAAAEVAGGVHPAARAGGEAAHLHHRRPRPRRTHVLLHGRPGPGETTLARIIAAEMQSKLVCTSGPTLERAGAPPLDRSDVLSWTKTPALATVARAAGLLEAGIGPDAAAEIARRRRGTTCRW
jgi:Holliday junction resolvasome RuvABC ATP-dependent DNA helicase subunit